MKKTSRPTSGSRKRSRKRRGSPRARLAPHDAALVAFAKLAKRLGLRWYVFGAQAVNLHGFPRATADVDLTLDLGSHTPRWFARELDGAGFEMRFSDPGFLAATRVIPVVHRASQLPIDVVIAGPGLEHTFLDEVERFDVGGASVPVLSIENLVITKVLAGRPRDREDVRELVAGTPSIDHTRIESVLHLLEEALGQADLRPLYKQLRRSAPTRRSR